MIDQADVVKRGIRQHPDAAVLLMPRKDGQYAETASDVIALLEEAGVRAECATDPEVAGIFGQKSADVILPLLILIGEAKQVYDVIDGVIWVARYFADRHRGRRIRVRAGRWIEADRDVRVVEVDVDGGTDLDVGNAIREAVKPLLEPPADD